MTVPPVSEQLDGNAARAVPAHAATPTSTATAAVAASRHRDRRQPVTPTHVDPAARPAVTRITPPSFRRGNPREATACYPQFMARASTGPRARQTRGAPAGRRTGARDPTPLTPTTQICARTRAPPGAVHVHTPADLSPSPAPPTAKWARPSRPPKSTRRRTPNTTSLASSRPPADDDRGSGRRPLRSHACTHIQDNARLKPWRPKPAARPTRNPRWRNQTCASSHDRFWELAECP